MEKTDLIEDIERAFKDIVLGDGVGIYEAEAIDACASDEKIAKARSKDRESWKKWSEIPPEVIEASYSALCFVDIEGMRFLLPAFMTYAVINYDQSASASVDSPIYALLSNPVFVETDVDSYFTNKQYTIMAKFLRFMVIDAGEDFVDSFCASQAYEKFWGKYDVDMA